MSASGLTSFKTHTDETVELTTEMEKRINECSYDDPTITPEDKEIIKQLARLKHKAVIRETLHEYERRGNFI